jgi:surface polysaccharide O-acyltransferase-like enzyme
VTIAPSPEAVTVSKRRSSLDVLRVAAICGVVAIHTFSLMVTNNAEKRGNVEWWAAVTLDLAFVWTVPVFVMISGALLLSPRAHRNGPADFYRRRTVRILPALIFWHLFYLLVVRVVLQDHPPSLAELYQLVLEGKVYTHLYFLWIILGLYIVAPVVAAFLGDDARRIRIFTTVICVGTVIVFTIPSLGSYLGLPSPISLTIFTMWMPYVSYFVAGYALARVSLTRRRTLILSLAIVALIALTVWEYGVRPAFGIVQAVNPVSYYGASIMVMSLLIFSVVTSTIDGAAFSERAERWAARLSDASFGVFLVHLAVLAVIRRFLPTLTDGGSLLELFVVYAVVVVVSYVISLLASRIPAVRRVF